MVTIRSREGLSLEWWIIKNVIITEVNDAVGALRYRLEIPNRVHSEGVELTSSFAGEFINFVKEIMPFGLVPLHPSKLQGRVIDQIISSTNEGKLKHESTRRSYCTAPYLSMDYSAGDSFSEQLLHMDRLEARMIERGVKSATPCGSYGVLWDINMGYPLEAFMYGEIGEKSVPGLRFKFTSHEAETQEDLEHCFRPDRKNKIIVNGEGFTVKSRYKSLGDEVETLSRYFFLGSFEAILTGTEYFVYGCNEARTDFKDVSTQKSMEWQPAFGTVR